MDLEILEDLGLSPSEIKTYVTLLEIGVSQAGEIIKKSRLQNSVAHRALKSLIEKGLISFVLKGKQKVYSATDPEYFFTYIDDKKKSFEKVFPELKKKQLAPKKETHTSMFQGKRGISEVYSKLINESTEELLTFGGSKETTDFMGLTWWKNVHIKRVDNGIKNKHIASTETLPYINFFLKLKLTQMKFLPSESFSQYQETAITDDYVAITVFADDGYSILINNKEVAEGYKKNFLMMWKLAKYKTKIKVDRK